MGLGHELGVGDDGHMLFFRLGEGRRGCYRSGDL